MATVARKRLNPVSNPDSTLRAQLKRLEAQLLTLREHLRHTQQLASLGTATAMFAHEFNNSMTPVLSYARCALDSDDCALMTKALEMTVRQTDVMTTMCERLLGFATGSAAKFETVALRPIIDAALGLICRDPAKDRIKIVIRVESEVTIWADPHQLQQVFFNLLLNSQRALKGRGGTITIDAVSAGRGRVRVGVQDTGVGMTPETLTTLFEPFTSTKPCEQGSEKRAAGLGMAICKGIIHDHQGTITVSSQVNVGTTVVLELHATCPAQKAKSSASDAKLGVAQSVGT